MKYAGMPMGMWVLFAPSFRRNLMRFFGLDEAAAKTVTREAKEKYRKIIGELPEFEKVDRFKMNIVNCAMLGAFILSMPKRPDVETLTGYYEAAMMTPAKEREKQIHRKRRSGHEADRTAEGRRPQPLFVEHGFLSVCRWQRL